MKLKQIQIQGFKSFLNRTVFNFDDAITLVVGPNGCGKSNLVDAIRWVMGEQSAKQLRGESMEDVIFHGTDESGSVGMSEVILTFDNADGLAPGEMSRFSEVQVSRRLFRSGESEYYLNRTPCRLRDITDLFLGSGAGTRAYSMIPQGRIEEIITMKPEQRRSLIEEAAGVSKYRSRKQEAERKMESTRQNLLRLRDIIAELKRQMNSLNRQAKKAERYKLYRDQLKELELELAAVRGLELEHDKKNAETSLSTLKDQELELTAGLEKAEAGLEAGRAQLTERERELSSLQLQIMETSRAVEKQENAKAMLNQEKGSLEQAVARLAGEREELQTRATALSGELDELALEIEKLKAEEDTAREDLARAEQARDEKEKEYQGLNQTLSNRERGALEIRAGLAKLKERIEWAGKRKEELEQKKLELAGRIEKLSLDLETRARTNLSYNEKLYQIKKSLADLKETAAQRERELQEAKTQRAVLIDRLSQLEKNYQRASSRLDSLREMERNFEGYERGVKSIMERKSRLEAQGLNGTYGLIAEGIKVDPEYELALEAVLGERLQSIVVKNRGLGLDNIHFLQAEQAGKSSFVTIEGARPIAVEVPAPLREIGAEALVDKVVIEGECAPAVRAMIGTALVVDDIDRAAELCELIPADNPLVTRDGIFIDERGVITGGSRDAFSGFLSKKREMEELEETLAVLAGERRQVETEAVAGKEQVEALSRAGEEIKERLHRLEIERNNLEKDLRQGTELYNGIKNELEGIGEELTRAGQAVSVLESEGRDNRTRIEADQQAAQDAESELTGIRTQLQRLTAEREAVSQRYTATQVRVAALREKLEAQTRHQQRLTQAGEEVSAGIEKRKAEQDRVSGRMTTIDQELNDARERREQAILAAKQVNDLADRLRADCESASQSLREEETRIKGLYHERETRKGECMEAELSLSQLTMKKEALEENVRDKFSRELAELLSLFSSLDLSSHPREERRNEREELKEKLERMGDVNLTAIEEFEEISQRHSFLSNQEADLIQALSNLDLTIGKINSAYRKAFKSTFEEVNEKFQAVFPRLFNGGKATLALTNPEDLLETGVEIMAQPPGKRMNSIVLLSGGEKALTATALIISLFQVKPSPFCLLDEVDAALDDINIVRFNEMIKELAQSSQLIVITHNRRTMDIADAIYGVTMEQKGVSKIVSVRFKEGNNNHAIAANS